MNMKKILALTSCVVLLNSGLAMAAGAISSGSVSDEAAVIYGGISSADAAGASATLIGRLSKGVKAGAKYDSGGYAFDTKHSSGNTRYGTAADATAIYKQEIGTAALAAPSAASYSAFADWTAM
jgi:hypothetical protein